MLERIKRLMQINRGAGSVGIAKLLKWSACLLLPRGRTVSRSEEEGVPIWPRHRTLRRLMTLYVLSHTWRFGSYHANNALDAEELTQSSNHGNFFWWSGTIDPLLT